MTANCRKKLKQEEIPVNKRGLSRIPGIFLIICLAAALLSGCGASQDSETRTGWQEIDGQRYYYLDNGTPATGWQTIEEQRYYFYGDGVMATGWLELDGKRFYLREHGSMVTGWLSLEGQQYYLGEDGAAAAGLQQIDGQEYLFCADGLLGSGLVELDGKFYMADAHGQPVYGWGEADGKRYYFGEDGTMVTGWMQLGYDTYYFLEDGAMAVGETVIDGQTCYFASNGKQLVLVNPWNYVPEDYTVELVDIENGHQIAAEAYEDYLALMADCKAAGLDPVVCSAYRTYEYQENLYNRKVKYWMGLGCSEEEAAAKAGTSVAVPGTSEHQLGLALDIIDNSNWNLNESQAETATQQWLMEHSWEYGFILRYPDGTTEQTGIIFEPWHYRYVGRETAAEIHGLDVCLEEYLQMISGTEK